MPRLIGLDPGGTTGWATFTWWEGEPYEHSKWECGQIEESQHHSILFNSLGMWDMQETSIICESFEYRGRDLPGLELISREYIGVAKLFSQERHVPIWQQTASKGKITKKSFVKKENLQRLGLWSPGYGHAMDAFGHILWHMIHARNLYRQELLLKGWK